MNEPTSQSLPTTENEEADLASSPIDRAKEQMLENLEWLLYSEEATFANEAEHNRRARQFDLLLWLLHLEPRLTPYPDPHTA